MSEEEEKKKSEEMSEKEYYTSLRRMYAQDAYRFYLMSLMEEDENRKFVLLKQSHLCEYQAAGLITSRKEEKRFMQNYGDITKPQNRVSVPQIIKGMFADAVEALRAPIYPLPGIGSFRMDEEKPKAPAFISVKNWGKQSSNLNLKVSNKNPRRLP